MKCIWEKLYIKYSIFSLLADQQIDDKCDMFTVHRDLVWGDTST